MCSTAEFVRKGVFTLLLVLLATTSQAAWIANGNPLCTATGDQLDIDAAPDGAGGMFVVWRDQRRGPSFNDVYGTHLLSDGSIAPGWSANGVVLSASGTASRLSAMADGSGGLLVAWLDGPTLQGRLQSVSATGILRPGFPANGKSLTSINVGGPSGIHLLAVGDGAGGLYVQWNAYNGALDALQLVRLDGSGSLATGWTGPVIVGGSAFAFGRPWGHVGLMRDPAGGVFTGEIVRVEDEPIGGSSYGRLQRTLASSAAGASAFLAPNGHDGTPAGHMTVEQMAYAPDGTGGVFAGWSIGGPLGPAKYMQRYLVNGSGAWPFATTAPVSQVLAADGGGGVFLAGAPLGLDRIELHRRLEDGSVPAGWASGYVVSASGNYASTGLTASAGLAFVAWSNGGAGSNDLRASAVSPAGTLAPGWNPGGDAVCTAAGDQILDRMLEDGAGGTLLVWRDLRAGNTDVYASLLLATGPAAALLGVPPRAGVEFALERVIPNPASAGVRIELVLSSGEDAILDVVDVAGRRIATQTLSAGSGRRLISLDAAHWSNGLYVVRLRQGARTAVRRLNVLH
jgi:hypothetical protein